MLVNADIPEYGPANRFNHEPRRPRKLLLHRKEIDKLIGAVQREGRTIIPTRLYWNDKGLAKLEVALAKGKKAHDKRDSRSRARLEARAGPADARPRLRRFRSRRQRNSGRARRFRPLDAAGSRVDGIGYVGEYRPNASAAVSHPSAGDDPGAAGGAGLVRGDAQRAARRPAAERRRVQSAVRDRRAAGGCAGRDHRRGRRLADDPAAGCAVRFHPSTAVGTDLLYASATKSVGTAVHGANKTIDWRVTGRMALGSVPATLLTVVWLYGLHQHGDSASKLISTVLGFALILTSVTLLFRRHIFEFAARRAIAPGPRATAILTVALGAALGVLITLSSVGAGAIGVTVLIFLYPKMPVARIVGSDIAHAVPLTLIAGAGHWMLGSVNLPLLGSLLVGSIPGIIIGSQLPARIPERFLRPVLATTLLLVGAKFAF